MQGKSDPVSARVQKETFARVQKETVSKRVVSEDFRPGIEGWFWGFCDRPELSERMIDEGD